MSSSSVARRSLPRVRVAPRAVTSDADDACFLSSGYGLTPDDWQEDVLDDWLGRRRDGRWAAATCGLAVPRQNGKNGVIEVRELFGMVALGEKFLHTAHEVKTARKAFLRIASFFENTREHPELAALVRDIRKTNGQEAVLLTNGGSVEFIARSKGSGRGFTVDVLVCDEAQDLTDEELAALLPTISAAPTGNPQVILTGTPPDPEKGQQGEVFRRVRADGEARRDKRLAWTDYGAPDGPMPDIDNRALWAEWNPALGLRLNVAEVERERALMSPERFAAERAGWWGDPNNATDRVVPVEAWTQTQDPTSTMDGHPMFALDISPSRSWAAIGVAGKRADDLWHIEVTSRSGVMDVREGTGWVLGRIEQLHETFPRMVLAVAGGSAAEALVPAVESLGIEVRVVRDLGAACGFFYDRVAQLELRHLGQEALNRALFAALRKDVADNAFVWWRRKSASDISALYAVTLALWVAEQDDNEAMSAVNNVW